MAYTYPINTPRRKNELTRICSVSFIIELRQINDLLGHWRELYLESSYRVTGAYISATGHLILVALDAWGDRIELDLTDIDKLYCDALHLYGYSGAKIAGMFE